MRRIGWYGQLPACIGGTCVLLVVVGLATGCSLFGQHGGQAQVGGARHEATVGAHAAEHRLSARQAWEQLMAGNERFANGRPEHPEQSVMRRLEVAKGQHPCAIVLTCSDSRVPPEVVFDAGLGDIFVIRVAGNTADDAAIGSMEYAVEHLGVPLIVVLGHSRCGAVKAAVETFEKNTRPAGHLGAIVSPIVPAASEVKGQGGDLAENAMRQNILRTVSQLRSSRPILAEALHERKLSIVGARYDLDSGKVTMIEQPSAVPAAHVSALGVSH
jgi:carbonic anhydrase